MALVGRKLRLETRKKTLFFFGKKRRVVKYDEFLRKGRIAKQGPKDKFSVFAETTKNARRFRSSLAMQKLFSLRRCWTKIAVCSWLELKSSGDSSEQRIRKWIEKTRSSFKLLFRGFLFPKRMFVRRMLNVAKPDQGKQKTFTKVNSCF